MIEYLKKDRWSSYFVGFLIGLLSLISFFLFRNVISTSTTFVRLAAAFWYWISPSHLLQNAYYMSYLNNNYWINWQAALVFGIAIGSYLAGMYHKQPNDVPPIWKKRFGNSKAKRYFGAFLGGVIILFGARLAGGCTSGQAISGGMQLAISGWLFMMGLFALGVPTAFILYKNKR